MYHKDCLQEWLNRRGDEDYGTCPTCRQLVKMSDCTSAYPIFAADEQNEEKVVGLTESQQQLKRHLEIDINLDSKMTGFNNLMHTAFTLLVTCFFIHIGCWYTQIKSLTQELEEHKLTDEEFINYKRETIPFGFMWLFGMLLCFFSSVLFGFWSEYMSQNGVRSFAKYLWICIAPSYLQILNYKFCNHFKVC